MLLNWLHREGLRPYYSDDDGKPQGGGADDGDKSRASDVLERYGRDALRLAEKLAEAQSDNYTVREKNRMLRQQLAEAQGKAPAEGAVVLTADDAKAWAAYQALGKPEDLGKVVMERDALKGENESFKRASLVQQAAEAHGYKAGALGKLPSLSGKALVLKDVKDADGKDIKQAFVSHEGTETLLSEFIGAHDPEFLGALTVETSQQHAGGTSYIAQSTGDRKPVGDLATRFIEQQNERRKAQSNPLIKQGA